jgi:hypothetical protein
MSKSTKGKFVRDWFNRRAEDAYTYVDESKRFFNWDAGRRSYSSYFYNDKNPAKDAGKFLGSMFKVLGVPSKFKNEVNAKHVLSHMNTSAPKIHIPIKMLKGEDGTYSSDPKAIDAFYGACIQNAAYASMQTDREYSQSMSPMLKTDKKDVKSLLTAVLNGERINQKIGERYPGYLKFVQKYKDYTFDENYQELPEDASQQARLLDLVVKMLRYPAHISSEDMDEFAKPIESIERMLKRRGGIPSTHEECASFAQSIAKIIYEYKEEEPPPSEGGEGEGEGEGEDSSKEPSKVPMFSGKSGVDELADQMMDQMFEDPEDYSEESLSSDDREAFDDFEDATKEPEARGDWASIDEGLVDGDSKIYFDIASGSKTRYVKDREKIDLAKAQTLARLFQRKSKDYEFSMRGMRSGRLDTGKLAEAKQHVPTIYERIGQVKTNKICVGVLIDESGSMEGEEIDKARQAAIFLNEVFKKMRDVELFIYGHSADIRHTGSTEINVYKEPGKVTDMYALGSVHARSENRDGTAILATAKRIRQYTKNNGILFVLSDGGPCARGYHGSSAIEDVRKKVLKAEAMGFQVIQIAINTCVPSAQMFNHYITMTDIKNLPKDMVAYMSRKVDTMIKESVFV